MSNLQNEVISLQTTQRVLKLYSEGLIPQATATHESALAAYRVSKVDFQTLLSTVIDVLRLRQEYYRTLADHEIAVAKIQEIIGTSHDDQFIAFRSSRVSCSAASAGHARQTLLWRGGCSDSRDARSMSFASRVRAQDSGRSWLPCNSLQNADN